MTQLVPLNDLAALRDAGIRYPDTVDAWRWLHRQRAQRGLDRAFLRIGNRVLVDTEAFIAAVREQHPKLTRRLAAA